MGQEVPEPQIAEEQSGEYSYTIVFPQHLFSLCHRQDPRAAWPFTRTKRHSHTLLRCDSMKPVNSKKQLALGTSHWNYSHPLQNSLKVKGSLLYLSCCLLKEKKGKEDERDNLQDYRIQCGQTTPLSPPYKLMRKLQI